MAGVDSDSPKAKLKLLRDRLAAEAPRARSRSNTPAELVRRVQAVLEQVSRVYLLTAPATSLDTSDSVNDAIDDVLVEGHLVLHELERVARQPEPAKPKSGSLGIDRRIHERHDLSLMVQLLRHSAHDDGSGGVALDGETTSRPARNASLGGIFVALPRDRLPQVAVGSVVHVSVSTPTAPTSFKARAIVMRRDLSGLGLSWIQDSDRVRKEIGALLEAVRKSIK